MNGMAKLTQEKADGIRLAYNLGGVSQRTLAFMYNVGRQTINNVVVNMDYLLFLI